MTPRHLLGFITPSSNVVVEQVTQAILRVLDDVSAHFTRIPVVGDGSKGPAAEGYDWEAMMAAGEMLGHAQLDVVCWNGTKGGGYGFEVDRELCARLSDVAHAPAVTSALATLDLLHLLGARTIGLITPYAADYQERMVARFREQGFETVCERASGLRDNHSFAGVDEPEIARMATDAVAERRPDALVMFCTNFRGAPVAAALEAELGVPVLDSVAVGVWAALAAAGADPARVRGWGRLFSLAATKAA